LSSETPDCRLYHGKAKLYRTSKNSVGSPVHTTL
jgi:hypothetical protein